VYSITSRSTFEDVATMYDNILRAKEVSKVPVVLVGNKCDLQDQRQVKVQEGADLAKRWGCPFFEASAKTKVNNEACFIELVRELRKHLAQGDSGSGSGSASKSKSKGGQKRKECVMQ